MDIAVGPVSAASMAAYVEFARVVLHSEGPGAGVPSDAARSFDGFLDEWDELAREGGDVTWYAKADPEVVEYLAYTFFRVAKEVREEAGDVQVVPEEAAPFYWTLVRSFLDALEVEGGSRAEFASHLREFWPGGGLAS